MTILNITQLFWIVFCLFLIIILYNVLIKSWLTVGAMVIILGILISVYIF